MQGLHNVQDFAGPVARGARGATPEAALAKKKKEIKEMKSMKEREERKKAKAAEKVSKSGWGSDARCEGSRTFWARGVGGVSGAMLLV